jgi:succinate dehydrogenase/fumarate reductase cytochrome b subunit
MEKDLAKILTQSGIIKGEYEFTVKVGKKEFGSEESVKTIDVVFDSPDETWIIETSKDLDYEVLGRLLAKSHLYERENPTKLIKKGILCRATDDDLLNLCRVSAVSVFEVEEGGRILHHSSIKPKIKSKDLDSDSRIFKLEEIRNPAANYRNMIDWIVHVRKRGWGMWAWLFRRLTALLLIFSTLTHVMKNQFGMIIPGGNLLTLDLMIFSGAFHVFDGIRIMLIEAFDWAAERENKLFIIVVVFVTLLSLYWIYSFGL